MRKKNNAYYLDALIFFNKVGISWKFNVNTFIKIKIKVLSFYKCSIQILKIHNYF